MYRTTGDLLLPGAPAYTRAVASSAATESERVETLIKNWRSWRRVPLTAEEQQLMRADAACRPAAEAIGSYLRGAR